MASVGQELLNVPFPAMVLKLASAIAEGQYQLDQVSMEIAKLMSKTQVQIPDITNDDAGAYVEVSMLSAGFQPTFYQFTDTIIEVKMAISMNRSSQSSVSVTAKVGGAFIPYSASITASYSSKYSYSVEGSSLLRTKITPVPPNQFIAKLYEMKATLMQKAQMVEIAKKEKELEDEKESESGVSE
jgi:hypothetical protein